MPALLVGPSSDRLVAGGDPDTTGAAPVVDGLLGGDGPGPTVPAPVATSMDEERT